MMAATSVRASLAPRPSYSYGVNSLFARIARDGTYHVRRRGARVIYFVLGSTPDGLIRAVDVSTVGGCFDCTLLDVDEIEVLPNDDPDLVEWRVVRGLAT